MPSGLARYQGYTGHIPRTGVPPEAYTPPMDSNAAKEQSRDGGKNRGGLPKHVQDHHSSKSDPKLSSPTPGGMYHGSYHPVSGRSQPVLPPQLENPPGRGESGTSSREKTQNKLLSIQEQELRVLGKTFLKEDPRFEILRQNTFCSIFPFSFCRGCDLNSLYFCYSVIS